MQLDDMEPPVMIIIKIQNDLFVSRDYIYAVNRVISVKQQEKNELSCIWSMSSAIYRYSTTKTGKYVKELSLSLP